MIGQLTTSFLQRKVNPITTSITCNQCADHAMDASKTGRLLESHGAILDSNDGGSHTKDGGVMAGGQAIYPIRSTSKHKARRYRWGIRAEAYWVKMLWHSHIKYWLKDKLKTIKDRNK